MSMQKSLALSGQGEAGGGFEPRRSTAEWAPFCLFLLRPRPEQGGRGHPACEADQVGSEGGGGI